MSAAYGMICAAALILVGVCFGIDKKKDIWLRLLFVSVFVCDLGYFLVSVARTLDFALMANRITYLGSVFLPFFMLMMIMNLSGIKCPKSLPPVLISIGVIILLIAASPGILPVYYSSVSIERVRGMTQLVREYGPLHGVYYIYLFGYFIAMIFVIIRAAARKTLISRGHGTFLLCAVLVNIAIWLAEQFLPNEFEVLSVSYIISELFLLLLYDILQEYGVTPAVPAGEGVGTAPPEERGGDLFSPDRIEYILTSRQELACLSEREKEVLRCILANKKRKDIADELVVTESTIKKHTSQIYKKLDVSSRLELFVKLKSFD